MTNADLESLSLHELRALRDRVDAAIRAGIARSRLAQGGALASAPTSAPSTIDLERERDAWQLRRR